MGEHLASEGHGGSAGVLFNEVEDQDARRSTHGLVQVVLQELQIQRCVFVYVCGWGVLVAEVTAGCVVCSTG